MVGDALDNAPMESTVELFKTELVHRHHGPYRDRLEVEQETADWVRSLGAHHVIDHTKALSAELKRIGVAQVSHVAGMTQSDAHFKEIVEVLAPQGRCPTPTSRV